VMTVCALVTLGARASAVERLAPATAIDPPTSSVRYEDPSATQQHRADRALLASLIAGLDDSSQDVREKAAMGLALRSSPEVIEPLLRALRDPDAQVREKAAAGLSLRRDPRVVDALLIAITDADAQVREKTAIALGTSGDSRAIDALKTAIHDSDQQVREKAAMGIGLVTSSPMGSMDRRELESGLTSVINSVLRALQ
jgi:HEAT repeat protein